MSRQHAFPRVTNPLSYASSVNSISVTAELATNKGIAKLRDSHVQAGVTYLSLYDDSWTSSAAHNVSCMVLWKFYVSVEICSFFIKR